MPPRKAKVELDFVDLTGDGEHVAGLSHQDARPSRKRKAAKEKRTDASGQTVRWSAKPSIGVKERMDRALSRGAGAAHRLFLVDRQQLAAPGSEGGGAEEFAVLGATGNLYTVTVCRQPQCTCPDFCCRRNLCKHILFVMLRVLRLPVDEPLAWQRALLADEVDTVLTAGQGGAGAAAGPALLASEAVRSQYHRLSGQGACQAGAGASGGRRPVDGDCPICQDAMSSTATAHGDKVTFCAECGNNLHRACMEHWSSNRRAHGQQVTCPLCRSAWRDAAGGAGGAPAATGQQYLNLGGPAAGTSLESLYGNRSVWVRAQQGDMSRAAAARVYSTLGHGGDW